MGAIRQSLPDKSTGREARARHLCVRLPRKGRAKQKEIGNSRKITRNSLSLHRPLHRIAFGIGPPRTGFVRCAVFLSPVPARLARQKVSAQASTRTRQAVNQISRWCVEFYPAIASNVPHRAPTFFHAYEFESR